MREDYHGSPAVAIREARVTQACPPGSPAPGRADGAVSETEAGRGPATAAPSGMPGGVGAGVSHRARAQQPVPRSTTFTVDRSSRRSDRKLSPSA